MGKDAKILVFGAPKKIPSWGHPLEAPWIVIGGAITRVTMVIITARVLVSLLVTGPGPSPILPKLPVLSPSDPPP